MADDLQAIVQRMIDAGESEENIATVIKAAQKPDTSTAAGYAATGPRIPMQGGDTATRQMTNPPQRGVMPAIGAAVGGVGGSLIPIPGASLAGAGVGRALGTEADGLLIDRKQPSAQDLGWSAARGAGEQAVGNIIGGVTQTAGSWLKNRAPAIVQSAIKPTVTAMRQNEGAAATGTAAQAKKMANTLLRRRFGNADDAAAAIKATEGDIQAALAAAPAGTTLDTATRVPRYLSKLQRSAERQILPGSDPGTVQAAQEAILNTSPLAQDAVPAQVVMGPKGPQLARVMRTDVTPQEGLELARGTGRWNTRKAWGELKGAEQETQKAAERAVRDSVKEAVPATKPLLQQQGEEIKSFNVLDRMGLREGNRDQIGLPAWVMGAHGGPYGMASAAGANFLRNNQLKLGYAADDLGRGLMQHSGATEQVSANMLRAALLALMQQQQPETQP